MQVQRLTLAIIPVALIIIVISHYPALAQGGDPADELTLSPYWSYAVTRWEPIILQEAERRGLDPDLIAALIWKESQGRSTAEGPAGAIGLMMVMPFPWRPSPEKLANPWTNVFWGARALATVIQDGHGDLYYSLAAYNGSWEQIHLRVTRRYAASVMDCYARAIAVRHGLPEDGDWLALFAVEGVAGPRTITALGPNRSLARYTERPWGQADVPMAPSDPPHAVAITFTDEQGTEYQVNVWLIAENSPSTVIPYAEQSIFLPPPAGHGRNGQYTAPAPHSPTNPVAPPPPTDTPTPPVAIPTPTLTPTPAATAVLTSTVPANCEGGLLRLEAWYLDRVYTTDGWKATIFAKGYGGDCMYTYAWNGETKSGPMSDSTTFEIDHTDISAVIIGTVSVASAGEMAEVGLFIKPPGDD